jgi:dienelactone hydrolase
LNRTKILAAALIVSVCLNVLGIVIAITFFKLRSSYHALSKQNKATEQKLAELQNATAPLESIGSMRVSKRTFASHIDGQEDFYAVLPPSQAGRLDYFLVVYLHGMGSSYMEPFIYPEGNPVSTALAKRWANVCVLSCNYRQKQSWGRDEAMADISQNIRELQQQYPIKQIVVLGTSMGGCTALTYATEAPADIREKIVGVVSVEGAGDLAKLHDTTVNNEVRAAIEQAMGGSPAAVPQEYARKSFIPNLGKLAPNVRVSVVSATQDKIVPTPLQEEIVRALQSNGHPTDLIKVESGHSAPPGETYVKAVEFVLQHP